MRPCCACRVGWCVHVFLSRTCTVSFFFSCLCLRYGLCKSLLLACCCMFFVWFGGFARGPPPPPTLPTAAPPPPPFLLPSFILRMSGSCAPSLCARACLLCVCDWGASGGVCVFPPWALASHGHKMLMEHVQRNAQAAPSRLLVDVGYRGTLPPCQSLPRVPSNQGVFGGAGRLGPIVSVVPWALSLCARPAALYFCL